jgi:hypothetical protein
VFFVSRLWEAFINSRKILGFLDWVVERSGLLKTAEDHGAVVGIVLGAFLLRR